MSLKSNVITAVCTAGVCLGIGAGMSGPGEPTLIEAAVERTAADSRDFRIFRVWSDGSIDTIRVDFDQPSSCEPGSVCGSCITGDCPSDVNGDGRQASRGGSKPRSDKETAASSGSSVEPKTGTAG